MRFRARTVAIALGLITIIVLLSGERRIPTGPDGEKRAENRAGSTSAQREIRVATFNIHGCKGADGIRDVERVAQHFDGIDIAGIQEVHGAAWSNPNDQAAHLARLCGIADEDFVFAPAETQWFGVKRFGNGLVSRLRVLAWQRIPLPRHDKSCRNMLLADIGIPNGKIAVLVTHVTRSNQQERAIQLEAVLDLFTSLEPPAILLADLNTAPDDPQMARFLAQTDATDAIKEGGVAGNDRVDWILVRGLQCFDSQRIDNDASDHPLFAVKLAIPE